MIYLKCPTCGTVIGNRQIPFEKGLEQIENNAALDEEARLKLKTELIESLNVKRYCCKMRMISFKQLTDIIK